VQGERTGCGFYLRYLKQTTLKNSATDGVTFKSSFSRLYREDGLITFDPGNRINYVAGFNIFEQATDLDRLYSGFGPSDNILIPSNLNADGALSLLACGVVLANAIYLI